MPDDDTATPRLLNIKEVQKRLSVSRSTVFNLIASGALRSVQIGQRRLVPESALVDYIEGLTK